MRTEYIQTKVRPIKKLYIIEPDDYDSFSKIFLQLQDEIDSINNLIFVNNERLFTTVNREFVKRSDPDIILNFSLLKDDKLSSFFDIFSVNPVTKKYITGRLGSAFFSFTRLPEVLSKYIMNDNTPSHILSGDKLENNDNSLFACLNYGLLPKEENKLLRISIFKEAETKRLNTNKDLINNLFDNENKFTHITNAIGGFGGRGQGTSIYEVDYNPNGYFSGLNKYFFVSPKEDLEAITYFWNIRSYYPNSKLVWVPVELLGKMEPIIDNDSVFVCFDNDIKKLIKDLHSSHEILQPECLYFQGHNERWTFFEHERTININNEKLIIQHPASKSFSDLGFNLGFVLEIAGVEESIYPRRRNLGRLFATKYIHKSLFPEQFLRISERGISKYIFAINPFQQKDIVETIQLPSFFNVTNHLFYDIGYNIKKTQKSSILEQSVNLLGSLDNLDLIAKKEIFDLLISLTPNVRTEKTVKKLLEGLDSKINSDDVLEKLGEIRENGGVYFPPVTYTLEDILSKSALKGKERNQLLPHLQELYDLGILLRGKFFKCSHCESNLWIQIDDVGRQNYCADCNNEVTLPVFVHDKQSSDHYRLNQLFVRAVDQGQLATLLLLNFFYVQGFRAFNYLSNLEIFLSDELKTDVDLFVKLGKKIGLCECKSNGGFNKDQAIELIKLGKNLKCDFIAFSCLNDIESKEITDLMESLDNEDVDFPIFVLGQESLFQPNPKIIQSFFEKSNNAFKTGPYKILPKPVSD